MIVWVIAPIIPLFISILMELMLTKFLIRNANPKRKILKFTIIYTSLIIIIIITIIVAKNINKINNSDGYFFISIIFLLL